MRVWFYFWRLKSGCGFALFYLSLVDFQVNHNCRFSRGFQNHKYRVSLPMGKQIYGIVWLNISGNPGRRLCELPISKFSINWHTFSFLFSCWTSSGSAHGQRDVYMFGVEQSRKWVLLRGTTGDSACSHIRKTSGDACWGYGWRHRCDGMPTGGGSGNDNKLASRNHCTESGD